ncbi:MAG: hypothetical protein KDC34_03600, partial [Saprospiraceae bacterium]|nr:hypothetical protein [Saprospiraceae bacterium]
DLGPGENSGFKITSYILLIVYYLLESDFEKCINKINSLNIFSNRNLFPQSRNERDIKMSIKLKTICQSEFNSNVISKTIDLPSRSEIYKYHQYKFGIFQHEIIPYEDLWEMILEILPNKPYYA